MYKFASMDFESKEIDQIVSLAELYSSGGTTPIDRRKYTKQVQRYAEAFGLIARGETLTVYTWQTGENELEWFVKYPNRYYLTSGHFDMLSLPQEALWRLVKPLIDERKGYSITSLKGWFKLNIYPAINDMHTETDMREMMEILCELNKWGYIIFQSAGTIWQITETPGRAVRSEL